jgi:hypothetical protein
MKDKREILRMLEREFAVSPYVVGRVLNIGRHRTSKRIEDGTIPVNAAGNVPSDWVLRQIRIGKSGEAA